MDSFGACSEVGTAQLAVRHVRRHATSGGDFMDVASK